MTLKEMFDLFVKHSDGEGHCFEKVKNRRSNRMDVHGMLLLDTLVPSKQKAAPDLISCSEHDEVWFETDLEDLAKVITEDQVIEMLRCGIYYDTSTESLHMTPTLPLHNSIGIALATQGGIPPLKLWYYNDRTYVSGLFKMHDEQGFSLADSLIQSEKHDLIPCLKDFKVDALRAGWSMDKIDRTIEEALNDSGIKEFLI